MIFVTFKKKKYPIASPSGERRREQTAHRHASSHSVECWSDVKIKKAVEEHRAARSLYNPDFFSCTFLQLQKQIIPVLVIFSVFVKSEGNSNRILRNFFL